MRIGGRYTLFLSSGRRATVVQSFLATAAERRCALPPLFAHQALARRSAECDGRNDLIAICEMVFDAMPCLCDTPTDFFEERVLRASRDGRILVVPGWWSLDKSYAASSAFDQPGNLGSPEGKVARQVMKGRQELVLEGASFIVLPAVSWAELKERDDLEVVRREEAEAALARMALSAKSSEEKAALIEAATMLADTKTPFMCKGILLVRRRIDRSFVFVDDRPVFTPSQLRKQTRLDQETHWVEIRICDDRTGEPVRDMKVLLDIPGKGPREYVSDESGVVRVEDMKHSSCGFSELRHGSGAYEFVRMP